MNLNQILNLKYSKNSFTKNDLNKVLNNIKTKLLENKEIILKLEQIDKQNFKNADKIDINKIISILEKYKEKSSIQSKINKNIILSYYGDPYLTIELCIQSIICNNKIILAIEDFMLGVNTILIEIVKQVLKERKINNTLFIVNLIKHQEIKQNINNINKIICIGNKNIYNYYKKENIPNIEFYPYKNILLYCDTEELQELQKSIYKYGTVNNIEIEVIEIGENTLNKNIQNINKYAKTDTIVVLTKNKNTIDEFKQKVKNSKIYINENPFKNINIDFPIEKLI